MLVITRAYDAIKAIVRLLNCDVKLWQLMLWCYAIWIVLFKTIYGLTLWQWVGWSCNSGIDWVSKFMSNLPWIG